MSQIILITALMAADPIALSGLKRRGTTELFKDIGTALKNLFLTVIVKGASSISSPGG